MSKSLLSLLACVGVIFSVVNAFGQTLEYSYNLPPSIQKKLNNQPSNFAPGAPGKIGDWNRPDKDAFGTTYSTPVWFTVSEGALSEVYYPRIDRAQTRNTFLMIKDGNRLIDERFDFKYTTVREPASLVYTMIGAGPGVKIYKTYTAHTEYSAVIVDYRIDFHSAGERTVYLVHNPAAESTPGGDTVQVVDALFGKALLNFQGDVRGDEPNTFKPFSKHIVAWSLPSSSAGVGFEGVNAPDQIIRSGQWPTPWDRAEFGNVEGALSAEQNGKSIEARVVIAFTEDANWRSQLESQVASIFKESYAQIVKPQINEWSRYLSGLVYDRSDSLAESSILVLKASEDKRNPGALIAAPAKPGIPWELGMTEQDYESSRRHIGDSNGGYTRVWPRDLYHKALSFISVGDLRTAVNVAQWFKRVQLRGHRNGAWAQNMWVDGNPSWQAFQLDQVGFPIVLVSRLVELGAIRYSDYRDMVIRAAEFILVAGPNTDQERWEENRGLSPNSLAAAVEGLKAAAWLEAQPGLTTDPTASDAYLNRATEWTTKLKDWALIKNGYYGDNYFARMEVGDSNGWNPRDHHMIFIHNKRPGETAYYREDRVLDGGFLEWIMAGLVSPFDPDFTNTLNLYDRHVSKSTRYGVGYYRYNFDAYGENHIGGAWPLLSAERGIAAIERKEDYRAHLQFIANIATPAGLIGEQDTVAVRPLGWSHGAYLLFKRSIADGRSFYIPRREIKR